jgi:hypothetical protein
MMMAKSGGDDDEDHDMISARLIACFMVWLCYASIAIMAFQKYAIFLVNQTNKIASSCNFETISLVIRIQ